MASWDDVAKLALALPGAEERVSREHRQWRVNDRLFVWQRPLRKTDLAALGDAAPEGPILGARVEHEGAKQALVQDPSGIYFTTPHFDGNPAILVQLDPIGLEDLEELVTEAWLCRASPKLLKEFREGG